MLPKFWGQYILLTEVCYAHQDCIFLVKNTVNSVKIFLLNFNIFKCNVQYFFDIKAKFSSAITLQSHTILQNLFLYTYTFDQFNASLRNALFFKKKKILQILNFWTVCVNSSPCCARHWREKLKQCLCNSNSNKLTEKNKLCYVLDFRPCCVSMRLFNLLI